MTITRPFLLIILHFSQIFLTDGFTFICLYHSFLHNVSLAVSYFARQVMRPFVRSYTDTSMVTRSPGKIRI